MAQLAKVLPSYFSPIGFDSLLTSEVLAASVQGTPIIATVSFEAQAGALLASSNSVSVLQSASLIGGLSGSGDIVPVPPNNLSIMMQSYLAASMLVSLGEISAMQSTMQAGLSSFALLETEQVVVWEYPVLTNDDLFVPQVSSWTQTGNDLSLE